MKTYKYFLPNNHIGIADIEHDDVTLYVQTNKRIFFGLVPWFNRVLDFEEFKLSNHDEDKEVKRTRRVGMYSLTCPYIRKYRNIDTFDIKVELKRMYETVAEKKRWKNKLNNFTCI